MKTKKRKKILIMLNNKEIKTYKLLQLLFPVQSMIIWKVILMLLIRKYRSIKRPAKNTEVSLYLVDDEPFAS